MEGVNMITYQERIKKLEDIGCKIKEICIMEKNDEQKYLNDTYPGIKITWPDGNVTVEYSEAEYKGWIAI